MNTQSLFSCFLFQIKEVLRYTSFTITLIISRCNHSRQSLLQHILRNILIIQVNVSIQIWISTLHRTALSLISLLTFFTTTTSFLLLSSSRYNLQQNISLQYSISHIFLCIFFILFFIVSIPSTHFNICQTHSNAYSL